MVNRRGVRRLLNTRVQLWRPITTGDGAGGQVTNVVLVADRVRARVCQPAPTVAENGDQSGADLRTPVYLLPDQDVRRGDEIRAPGGRVFDVDAVLDPSATSYRRADCIRRQPEGAT